MLVPAGLYLCFKDATDAKYFLALYGATAVYFAGVMVCYDYCIAFSLLLGYDLRNNFQHLVTFITHMLFCNKLLVKMNGTAKFLHFFQQLFFPNGLTRF